jgi:hypothetical protein
MKRVVHKLEYFYLQKNVCICLELPVSSVAGYPVGLPLSQPVNREGSPVSMKCITSSLFASVCCCHLPVPFDSTKSNQVPFICG